MTAAKDQPKKAPKTYKPRVAVTATLKVGPVVHDSSGTSVLEALEGLSVRNPRGRGILTVSSEGRTISKILAPLAMARLFSPSPTMRQMQLKNLFLMFRI